MATPYSLTILEETSSTQDAARLALRPRSPAVVVAHRQTAGRGRSGSDWENATRAVAVSVAFRPRRDGAPMSLIPLIAGVAARRTMGPAVTLKWPNDVEIDDAKVAGILVEASTLGEDQETVVVAGMGVNLFWPDSPSGSCGLHAVDPGPEEGSRLAVEWAETLLELVRTPGTWPTQSYREACSTLGRDLTWDPDGSGTALDIDDADGSLIVETAGGVTRLTSGAVRHVRPLSSG